MKREYLRANSQEAKRAQAVVRSHHDDWLGPSNVRAVIHVKRALVGAFTEGSAVEKYHHRQRRRVRRVGRGKYVQVQAIFTDNWGHVRIVVRLEIQNHIIAERELWEGRVQRAAVKQS